MDECLPGHADAMKASYSWFDPSHPTLSDYIDVGYQNGLIALDSREYSRPDKFGLHSGISPLGQVDLDGRVLDSVIKEINQFRPDVRLSDFFPFSHAILFKKINKNIRRSRDEILEITNPVSFHYRPKNPIMKKARNIAVKLHSGLQKK